MSISRKCTNASYTFITLCPSALMKVLWLMGLRDQCRVCQNARELWPRLPFHNEHWHREHWENIRSVWLIADLQYSRGQDMTCNTRILKSLFLTLVHLCTYLPLSLLWLCQKAEPYKVSMYCTYMWQNYIINMDVATYLRLNKEQTVIFSNILK